MIRRHFIAAALSATALAASRLRAAPPAIRTRWNVNGSEAFDAIAFLGALSGRALYTDHYAQPLASFAPRLPPTVRADVPRLADEADASPFGLLWPNLANLLSPAGLTDIGSVITALSDLDRRVWPWFVRKGGAVPEWPWLEANAPRLRAIFTAMRDAGFAELRRVQLGAGFDGRVAEVTRALASYDVVRWQEKLTGRTFDPTINVVLLAFSKPHGAKMQDQTFLQAADYDTATAVRIAAHEVLHPPVPMDGSAAKAALAILAKDPLIPRIVREHDPKWGYTTLEGMLN
jgi:hypothetical protein